MRKEEEAGNQEGKVEAEEDKDEEEKGKGGGWEVYLKAAQISAMVAFSLSFMPPFFLFLPTLPIACPQHASRKGRSPEAVSVQV